MLLLFFHGTYGMSLLHSKHIVQDNGINLYINHCDETRVLPWLTEVDVDITVWQSNQTIERYAIT